jgi:CubicO group peptidase (beta-lactamase class C family)
MTRKALVAALATALALPAAGGPSPAAGRPDADEERFDRLVAFVAEGMRERGIPGVAVGVLHAGRSFTRGLGVTSVLHPLTVTDETLFQVGSISKTYTGTALMRLVEGGRLDLGARVRASLPGFRVRDAEASERATLRDLLTHVGGWEGDYFDDTGGGDDALGRIVADLAGLEQVAPVGALYSYNNAGFYVAARILEVTAGKPFEAALRELVLEPLGLGRTFVSPADVMTHRFVVGHHVGPRGTEVLAPWPLARAATGVGGVVCDVRDLLRYARFHLGDGTAADGSRLLAPETLRLMHTPAFTKQGTDEEMALTWHVDRAGGLRRHSHGGSTLGQQALLQLVPERGFALAVLTNSGRGMRLAQEVSRWAFKELLGADVVDPEPLPASDDELAPYLGRYSRPFADVEVTLQGGRLQLRVERKYGFPRRDSPLPAPEPPAPFGLFAPDRLIGLEEPVKGNRAEILRLPDGSIGWLRLGGRLHRRVSGG